jgi:arylsulfatase A-like enzyme
MPTLLELAGVSPNGARVQGRSLARVLAGVEPLDPDAPIHLYRRNWGRTLLNPGTNVSEPLGFELRSIQVHGEKHALREGPWKYVFGPQERSRILYNLTTDPGETTNIFNTEREIGEMMHTRLSRWIVDNRVAEPLQNDLTEDDRTRLRALGYVD